MNEQEIDPVLQDILNKKKTAEAVIICGQAAEFRGPAETVSASREQLNNIITKNIITQAMNPAGDPTRDWAGEITTSSSVCPEGQEKEAGLVVEDKLPAESVPALRDSILGIELQRRAPSETGRLTIHMTVQLQQFEKPLTYTAYLLPRDRGREFVQISDLDKELYALSKQHRHWMIGHLTEKGTKQLITDITVTYDPNTEILVLWFTDYSQCIEVSTNNKPVTPNQQKNNYVSAGVWGQPVNLPKTKGISFLQARSFAGGQK